MSEISIREAYGQALAEVGSDSRIVALDSDLSTCTMSTYFGKKYPDRFFNCGIAEANMVDMAAGFALTGKIPFCHSFAMFSAGRCFEMIRNSIAYPNLSVRVIGSHAGLTVGRDGATHQCLEDVAIMRCIPNMTVIAPCDAVETRLIVEAMVDYQGPIYLRTSRIAVPNTIDMASHSQLQIGKGIILREGTDVTIAVTGIMAHAAMQAAALLQKDGIQAKVIHIHTIKPLDSDLIISAAKETGAMVTVEEHSVIGGFGSAVCELLSQKYPIPLRMVGVQDKFGHSGEADELLEEYRLTAGGIVEAAYAAMGGAK